MAVPVGRHPVLTDRVALTDEFIATLPLIVVPKPEVRAEVPAGSGVQADGPVKGDFQVPGEHRL